MSDNRSCLVAISKYTMNARKEAICQILEKYIRTSNSIEEGIGVFITEEGVSLEMADDICSIGDFFPLSNLIKTKVDGNLEIDMEMMSIFTP